MVFRRCLQLLKNESIALDVTQDTFLKLFQNRDSLNDEAISSLIYRVATNLSLNKIRTIKRHPETQDDELVYSIAIFDSQENQTGAKLLLDKLFKKSNEQTKLIATLHYLDGFTLEEVAEMVNLSLSGVRKKLDYLRKELKEIYDLDEVFYER
ncbi:RNA polymerase sigma factor [bacterium]|nr:RNA polymerase sigma factor [bacterium]